MKDSAKVGFFTEHGMARKWRQSLPSPPSQHFDGEEDRTKWPGLIAGNFRKQFDAPQVERTYWARNSGASLQADPPSTFTIPAGETAGAIAQLAPGKTRAPDLIVGEMLQELGADNILTLFKLFTGRVRGLISAPHDWHSIATTCFPKCAKVFQNVPAWDPSLSCQS